MLLTSTDLGGKILEIISSMAIKGGVGKTTLAFQLAKYIEGKNKNVLMLDMDSQRSLTGLFIKSQNDFDNVDTTADILLNPRHKYTPTKVSNKISIFPATNNLNEIAEEMATKTYKELALFMWFAFNVDSLNKEFYYVIIYLPPAWNVLSQNGVTVADKILSPMEPSRFGYESHAKVISAIQALKDALIDPVTGKEYVTAEILFLGNRVKHNTASSRDFLEALAQLSDVIGSIPEKELVNSSMLSKQSIWDYGEEHKLLWKQRAFYEEVEKIFERVLNNGEV